MRRRKMIIGYGRTSTFDQAAGLAAQERDLAAAGATKLFTEQVSSIAKRDRLAECLAFLREGDVLMVTKPDRLARSTAELLAIEADMSALEPFPDAKRAVLIALGGDVPAIEMVAAHVGPECDLSRGQANDGTREHAFSGRRDGEGQARMVLRGLRA
jgi:hypothetical protein